MHSLASRQAGHYGSLQLGKAVMTFLAHPLACVAPSQVVNMEEPATSVVAQFPYVLQPKSI